MIVISHSKFDRTKLPDKLKNRFQRDALSAADWKTKSPAYKEADGIENELIWGSQYDGGKILFAIFKDDESKSLIWAEYGSGSDRTFVRLRQIIENSIQAIMDCQGAWRPIKVTQSELYEHTDRNPLGVRIKIETWSNKFGKFSPKELMFPGATYFGILALKFGKQAIKVQRVPWDFFSTLSSYSDPALAAWISIILWSIIVLVSLCFQRHVEVKFDA